MKKVLKIKSYDLVSEMYVWSGEVEDFEKIRKIAKNSGQDIYMLHDKSLLVSAEYGEKLKVGEHFSLCEDVCSARCQYNKVLKGECEQELESDFDEKYSLVLKMLDNEDENE